MVDMSQEYSVKPKKSELAKSQSDLLHALVEGDQLTASRLIDTAISERWEPSNVYVHVIGHCLAEIGARWQTGDLSIATEHRATQMALRLLGNAQQAYVNGKRVGRRAVITSVEGDTHLIGGLTFADLLRFEGWDVDFLGADTPADSLVELVENDSPELVGLSLTIEEFLPNASKTVSAIKQLQNPPVVVVGGAVMAANPILEADFCSEDAVKAVNWVQEHFDLNESSVTVEVLLSDLGERIRRLRKDQGLSQQGLASQANLDRSYLSAVENGKQNVSFATLKGISDALGVGIAELISREWPFVYSS
jgi:methanogenic corrinoid protein MtbC1/DNA-binding XRE family transcriptional regulator